MVFFTLISVIFGAIYVYFLKIKNDGKWPKLCIVEKGSDSPTFHPNGADYINVTNFLYLNMNVI